MKLRTILLATALLAAGSLTSASAGRPAWGVSVGAFLGGVTLQIGAPAPPPPPPPPVVVLPPPPLVVHYPAPVIMHPAPVVYVPVAVHPVPVGHFPPHGFHRRPHRVPVVWPGAPHCR